jgi:phytoene dehydrogenase-like protein
VHAPIGGFQAVSNAFEGLAKECGVEIQYNKSITSISEDGVWMNDEKDQKSFLPADLVICNADLPFATKTLVNKEASAPPQYDWDDRFDYSSGKSILIYVQKCILWNQTHLRKVLLFCRCHCISLVAQETIRLFKYTQCVLNG